MHKRLIFGYILWNVILIQRYLFDLILFHFNYSSNKLMYNIACITLQIVMTSQSLQIQTLDEAAFECPICLSTLVLPITLTCGHSFCQPCIKTKHFKYVKNVCPICRKTIPLKTNYFSVNVLLDQFLQNRYKGQKSYEERLVSTKRALYPKGIKWLDDFKKWFKQMTPWIIICILLYHLVNVKLNVFAFSIEKYKKKALEIANSIKGEESLDFKFLLFSQFMRILFSNIIIS